MKSERFFSVFLFLIIFVITVSIKSWAQCPSPSQLLTHGYHISINYPHKAEIGNLDEFGVVDLQPFILKVGSYPPVKAIYIDEYCESGVYYFSFDTDNDRYPVNYVMAWHEPCTVKTYRLDQEGNYTSGFQVLVTPPNSNDTGGPTADFLMKYNGTPHAVDWNIFNYPWSSFVSAPVAYSPQAFEVNIQGVDNLNYNSSSEFIADINGGSGNYDIEWSYRELPNGNWTVGIYYDPSIYYTIPWPNGNNYYYYDNEYKYNLIMPSYSVELKVSIYDNEFPIEATSTKIISLNPEPVTFINHIENTENFGELILNENKIDPITSGSSRNLIFGNNYTIRTDELPFIVDWGSTGKTEKHFRWEFNNPNVPPVNALNNSFTFQGSVERTMKSRFQPTDQAIIKTFIDGVEVSGLNLEFKDPWLYFSDENSNWFQYTDFIQYPSPLNLFNNSTNSYGGIFKGQSGPPLWNSPYYSVKSPANIYIPQKGKTHPLYLTDWSYDPSKISLQHPGSSQTAVVFKEADAQLTANLKGHLMSNSTSGISSNSQRKMVRTDNGIYHVMYESMGNVFYTHSLTSNFDGEWAADQLVIDNAKNPAIEYDGNIVKAVCEYYDPAFSTNVDLWLLTFEQQPNGIYENTDSEIFATCTSSYFGSAKPVISYNPAGVALVYRKNSTEELKVKTKWLLNGIWTWQAESTIPQTDANSINPSIIGETGKIHIAFESLSTIKYKLAYNQGQNWLYYNLITLSTGSGYTTNNYPSISLCKYTTPYVMVSWHGNYIATVEKRLAKENDYSDNINAAVAKVGYGTSWGGFSSFSNNVYFTNNNSLNTSLGSILTWSESNGINGPVSKYVRRKSNGTYDPIASLSTNGIQTLVSNGSSFDNMKVMVFNTSTPAPYLLNKCTDSFPLNKVGETKTVDISYGRSGVVEKNGIEFLFSIGDVQLDGQTIKFVERVDTLPVVSIDEMNLVARTNAFGLSSESELIFSDYYYVVNKNFASSLSDEFNVAFKCELVNASTNQVVGTFDNVTYNKLNVQQYDNPSYLVDCSGIETGNYYLRLFTTVNEDVNFFISDIQRDDIVLEKSNLLVRNFKGEGIPIVYDLAQNFPNPFNPSTTIRYQIPQDGIVTLKIYDILGSEVATLVNEEKVAGKYEVNFNASSLASGVYIYKIQAGDFVSSKKMILIK